MSSVTLRLDIFIQDSNMRVGNFEESIGVGHATISKAINNNKSIGSEILNRILNTYPDLSAEWLMRGEGDMLRSSQTAKNITNGLNNGVNGDITVNAHNEHNTLIEVVDFLRVEITEKNNQLKEKDNQLKEKDNFISKLLDKLK